MQLASFLLYLSSVEEGGETMFPFEVNHRFFLSFFLSVWFGSVSRGCKRDWILMKQNERNMNGSYGYEQCIGLRVKPRRGDAIFFYNLFPNGTIDEVSVFRKSKPI